MSRGARESRVKTPRTRRCIASGETAHEASLIRVVAGPDGVIVPDIAAKLPGRGAWISAGREAVAIAIRRKAFQRAFEGPVTVPEGLADEIERQLAARALSILGLARRAGRLAMGYDGARGAITASPSPAWRIEASDGAADGRRKLDQLAHRAAPGLPVAMCFSAAELGAALGRSGVVHLVLSPGPEAAAFGVLMGKLGGFRPVGPQMPDGPAGES